ncbi:hypothetical protein [Hydrocoleum sp. CS-953]|nr:hypothetical protein [Hydrocoleum sp. CS-953]
MRLDENKISLNTLNAIAIYSQINQNKMASEERSLCYEHRC